MTRWCAGWQGLSWVDGEEVGAVDRDAEAGERPEQLPDDVPVPVGLRSVLFTRCR